MSKFQFKNRSYLKIEASAIQSNAPLSCAVFIFLEKNQRLFKIRDRDSSFEESSLRAYQEKTKNQLYILDPLENADTFSFSGEINPKLSQEYLPKQIQPTPTISNPESSIAAGVPPQEALPAIEPAGQEAVALSPTEEPNSEVSSIALGLEPPSDAELKTLAEQDAPTANTEVSPKALEEKVNEPAASDLLETETLEDPRQRALEEAKEKYAAALKRAQKKDESAAEEPMETISDFAAQDETKSKKTPEEEEARARFEKAKSEEAQRRKFSSESEPEAEQKFGADKAEEEEETRISAWHSKDDQETRKISQQMETMEEEFAQISPDAKQFAEELQIIAASKTEEKRDWKTRLPENSPKLLGLEKHDAAAMKLSYSLGQHLANLRSELNHNSRMTPSEKSTEQDLKIRKKELKESIEKNEVLFVLMEALDDEEMETSDLPEPFQSMSKPDLVRHVEKSLKELKGSLLLSEEDSQQVQKKVEIIKAKHLSMYGDSIESTKAKLASLDAQEVNPAQEQKISSEVEKEYIKTSLTINITKEIIKKRSELAELIKKAATSGPDRITAEEDAFRYQESIRELESLAFSVESDEPLDEKKIAPYKEKMPEEFRFSPVAEKTQEILRITQSLDALKESLVKNKVAAEESAENLREIIDGNEADEVEQRAKIEEEEVKKLVSGSDGKFLQSGVFAATFFRHLGYRNKKLEGDLLLATYLFETEEAEFQDTFPQVLPLHRAAHASQEEDEIVAKDIALAIQLARSYNQWPGVITGKFSVDSKLFRGFFEGLEKEKYDPIMLERLKLNCDLGQNKMERESIIALAKTANEQIKKWRRSSAA